MAYYDVIAKGYNELHSGEQLNKLSIIRNNIKINKNTKILDVGCGTGISSGFDCFVAGIDPSIGLLRQNKNGKKILGLCYFRKRNPQLQEYKEINGRDEKGRQKRFCFQRFEEIRKI